MKYISRFSIFLTPIFIYGQLIWWPMSYSTTPDVMTSAYGPRDRNETGFTYDFHRGIDIKANWDQWVYSSHMGTVVFADEDGDYGKVVRIWSETDNLGTGYAHLDFINVEVNDLVSVGTYIGKAGETGEATAVHLHFNYYRNEISETFAWHPMNILPYTNTAPYPNLPDVKSPDIVNAIYEGSYSDVQKITITIRNKKAELDMAVFGFHCTPNWLIIEDWEYQIDFDDSLDYRVDDQIIQILLYGDVMKKINIKTTPHDFSYLIDDFQVIEFELDFSEWSAGPVSVQDIKMFTADVQGVGDIAHFFSPALFNYPHNEKNRGIK